MSTMTAPQDAATAVGTDRVLLVSNDAHVSPPLEAYREYCPREYLSDLDDYAKWMADALVGGAIAQIEALSMAQVPEGFMQAAMRNLEDPLLHYDPHTALRHMDEDGVAVETFFHGTMNMHPIPFLGTLPMGSAPFVEGARGRELAAAGMRMYNRWLADYCSVAPERMLGMAQIPMWDVDLAVQEAELARGAGLRGINFPAPRPTLPDYNLPVWAPLWSACASLGLPLNTHGASAPVILDLSTYTGPDGVLILGHELVAFSRRALPFMLLGGVFERHPGLKLVFTEQPSEWIGTTLADLDSLWGWSRFTSLLPRPPSEYFWSNCYVGLSFMSNSEARTAVEQGSTGNVMWGRDYPHVEGTWPYTTLSLRKAVQGLDPGDVRKMLGGNAVEVYDLDLDILGPVAERIGPTLEELMTPLADGEVPPETTWTMAFREGKGYS